MKAVIYARYSSHNQREESIEGQLRECHEFARKNEFTVVDEYIDRAISGKTDNRPAFQKLIKDSEKGHFDAVIMYTLDRFARNRYDSAIYKAKLKKNGVKVLYAKQEISDSPEGIILESVLEGMAEYYSENLRRGVKRGMHDNVIKGLITGQIPLGYRKSKDSTYEIDPVGAKAVKEIFTQYADGKPIVKIIEDLNSKGYRTKRGEKFTRNSFSAVLRNEKYIGTYKYGDMVSDVKIPVIIDKKLFERVQMKLDKNKRAKARNKAYLEYLLSGKLFCGHCKAPMLGESGTSKTGQTHHYYKCGTRKKTKGCNKKTEKKVHLEKAIVEHTISTILTPETIDKIATKVVDMLDKEAKDNSLLVALKKSLKEVETKINNILIAIEQGIIATSTKERLLSLEEEKDQILVALSKEEIALPKLNKDHIVRWLASFKDGDIDDIEYQKSIIDLLVNAIYIYDNPDGSRKIVVLFNVSDNNKVEFKYSDIDGVGSPIHLNPNSTVFFIKDCFGFVFNYRP